jgi:hypothetical protein
MLLVFVFVGLNNPSAKEKKKESHSEYKMINKKNAHLTN